MSRRPVSGSVVAATLAKNRLGTFSVVAIVMSAAAPLTVIAGGATTGWAVTGLLGIPIAYLAVAVVLNIFFVGFIDMSRRIQNAGAFYAYVTLGLGRHLGVAAAFVALVAYGTMQVGLYGAAGPVAAGFFRVGPWWVWALACWAIVAVMGVLRIDFSGWLLAVLLGAEISVAAVLAVVQVAHPADGVVSFDALVPALLNPGAFAVSVAIGLTGFAGVEGTSVYAEETKDPQRTTRNATFIALGLIGGLYMFCSWAMSVAAGSENIVARATAETTNLTFNLAAGFVPAFVITAGRLLFITSLLAALIAFHNTFARYVFALGREGVLPAVFAKVSPRTGAPIAGSITQSVIGFVVIASYAVAGWDPTIRMFFWLTCVGGLGVTILMAVTSLSVVSFNLRRGRKGRDAARHATVPQPGQGDGHMSAERAERTGDAQPAGALQGVVAPGLAAVLLIWILVATLQTIHVLLGVDATDPLRWISPAGYLVAAVIGVLWAAVLRRVRRDVFAQIGAGASATPTARPSTPLAAASGVTR